MTDATLQKILSEAEAKKEGGEFRLGDGRRLTFYAGHAGVSLTVTRIEGVKILEEGTVVARNDKGDRFFVSLADLFGVAVEGSTTTSSSRKAGFLG